MTMAKYVCDKCGKELDKFIDLYYHVRMASSFIKPDNNAIEKIPQDNDGMYCNLFLCKDCYKKELEILSRLFDNDDSEKK